MKETYIKKIFETSKEKEVDLLIASAMVFYNEKDAGDFDREAFDIAEEAIKDLAPELCKVSDETGFEGFDFDAFVETIIEERNKNN